jgi:hypothetical protein
MVVHRAAECLLAPTSVPFKGNTTRRVLGFSVIDWASFAVGVLINEIWELH